MEKKNVSGVRSLSKNSTPDVHLSIELAIAHLVRRNYQTVVNRFEAIELADTPTKEANSSPLAAMRIRVSFA